MIGQGRSGEILTIAGTGEPGYEGDGQPGTQAVLNEPKNVCFDAEGNLLIADSENHVIRRLRHSTGVIETIAGCMILRRVGGDNPQSSTSSPTSHVEEEIDPLADVDEIPGQAYSQTPDLSGTVRYIVGQGMAKDRFAGDGALATRAQLNFPSAVAVDAAGNLFIADTWNHRIRRVDSKTGMIQTVAGTGQAKWTGDGGPGTSASLNEPVALVVDGTRLYIADQSNNRIRMLDLESGVITTIAGTGESGYTGDGMPAIESALAGPSGLALDRHGNLYIADTFNGRIRILDHRTGILSTVAGDGAEFRYERGANEQSQALARPYGIAITPQGHVLITDSDHHLIRKWDAVKKEMTLVAGNGQSTWAGDGGPSSDSSLSFPFGVAVDALGNIAIADTFNHRIRYIPV
ncbi:NHL domain-containing protein [Candidatus Nitrospira allomarina]|jgi:DNA-binding beta-propeller fold protein YncE|uniref:SMP-30/gluconolactonase/LRE family protein n=1 Tax=Candidatus Nitrospira allomarina TaxID=3020900 RepID=A0AA96K0N9_9BACT|nr:SMP-30/gluconolactonase/LRE family protein [Candidatus Nitrospira allomarina]WNM59864.1 SMP-30/gluconolactonase/LRE family protein [Candidatus Nitrospira allomarina]